MHSYIDYFQRILKICGKITKVCQKFSKFWTSGAGNVTPAPNGSAPAREGQSRHQNIKVFVLHFAIIYN